MDTDYRALWGRLDELLAVSAPHAFRNLRGPITDAGLAWLQSQARKGGVRRLDPAVDATYAAHDGAKGSRPSLLGLLPFPPDEAWAASCEWHSSWVSREELATWQDAIGSEKATCGELYGEDDTPGWLSRWLPMGRDGGGNAVMVDLGSGELFAFDHEVAKPVFIATLAAFLMGLEVDLRNDAIGEDDQGDFTRDLAGAASRPFRKKPDYVDTLLALLVERTLIAIEPSEALRDALRSALEQSGKTRTKRIIALLYEHPDVTEVFADDDVLAVLLDEFA